MVEDPADYIWSSYQCNALGKKLDLCTPHQQYMLLGSTDPQRYSAYRYLFADHIDASLISDIRNAANKSLALGNDRFKDEIEFLTNRRVRAGKMGRPLLDAV